MSNPKGLISPDQAKELNNAFTERCELISSKITNRPDNRSSWYSLDDLRTFLDLAEAQAKDLGYEMDGVRIYCGAYPTQNGQAGYSTSFLVPTSSNKIGDAEGDNSHDIQGANGLNIGSEGRPPGANYPQ
ncbi:hypothetical protein [Winogradskyella sp. PG-2]|uniref:hypothetical protein n=1 Tax=Winogradskyella sp. PG-2 TaxID=754409 RepID=UPI000458738C|nr:hypothetical protein [Winogradskyella sp. PG-2]BAO77639.1 hypothetical protein WPG_3409 [Winogradskyella sp. PG-2]